MPAPGLLLLVDLDGVLYRGAEPVPGIAAVLATRASRGDDVVYVTNNSMWYREDYVERIARMGAPVSADQIVSSPRATALYLRDHEPSIRHVLTVGASGMDRELEDAGFRVTPAGDIGELIRGSGAEGTDVAGLHEQTCLLVDDEIEQASHRSGDDRPPVGHRLGADDAEALPVRRARDDRGDHDSHHADASDNHPSHNHAPDNHASYDDSDNHGTDDGASADDECRHGDDVTATVAVDAGR